jgi:hypothetical protein
LGTKQRTSGRLLFLKVKSQYNLSKYFGDFRNDFGGWKMKIILVIFNRILVKKPIEFCDTVEAA